MIARKPAMLVLALLVLQFLGPLLHAHFSGPADPTQTSMHMHTEGFPEFTDTSTLEPLGHLLAHEHLITTVTLQQTLTDQNELSIPDWQILLSVLLLLFPLLMQGLAVEAIPRLIPPRPQRYPNPHSPRAPPGLKAG